MVRVPGIDPEDADPALRALFESQTATWGAPLAPYPCTHGGQASASRSGGCGRLSTPRA